MCDRCGPALQTRFHTALSHTVGDTFGPLYAEYTVEVPRLDFAFPEYLIGIEVDVSQYHSSAGQRAWDEHREAFLRQLGWHVIRVSGHDVSHNLQTTVNVTIALMNQYIVGRAMEQKFAKRFTLPDRLFVAAPHLIQTTATERTGDIKFSQDSTDGRRTQEAESSPPPVKEPSISEQKGSRSVPPRRRRVRSCVIPPTLYSLRVGDEEMRVSELHHQIFTYLSQHGEATTEQLAHAVQKPEGTIRTVIGRFGWARCIGMKKRGRHLIYTITGPFPEREAS